MAIARDGFTRTQQYVADDLHDLIADMRCQQRSGDVADQAGAAAGGGAGVAMACDFAIAAPTARYDIA